MAKRKRLNIIVEQHRDETSNTQTEDSTQSEQQSQFFDQQPDASTDISNGSQQPKKVRGPTLMYDIWDLDKNERAVIEVDPVTHIPIGGDDGDLARFIGTMVRMSNLAPIDYLSWLHMPEHMKDEMWRIVESKFKFVPSSNDDTKKWVMKKMNDQWRYWKSDLKSRGFDDSLTEEEMLAKMPDDRVDKDQYKKLVQYWCTEKAKGISSKNKGNCAKYDEPHCLGTRSLQKFIREKTKKANGVTPSRAQIYIGSRTRKDENIVNERATQVMTLGLSGIPCNHAISCMFWLKEEPENYIDNYFKKDTYLKAYESLLQPLSGKDTWLEVEGPHVLPPPVKKMPGRPKKKRRRDLHEDEYTSRLSRESTIMICQIYHVDGHNRRRCPLRGQSSSSYTPEGQVNQPMSSGSSGRGGRTTSGRGGRSARGHRNSTERSMTSHGFRVLVGEETGNTYFRFIHMLLSRGMEWVFNSRT